jgi:hypothetical protein
MKMVKSLLLGSAAALVAAAGAQAADLPVKAKAVEYVKVCSLYGVGYYYIPGTDTCIKVGGYVRWEAGHNVANSTNGYPGFGSATNPTGDFTRHISTFNMLARFRLTTDVRTQTEYGTLRSYFSFGLNVLNTANETAVAAPTGSMERAFIQFAGFTAGRADSFFAFYNGAAYGFVPMAMDGSSGPAGKNVFAYTWQFGNGLSASLSAEDAMAYSKPVVDLGNGPGAAAATSALLGATPFAASTSDQFGQAMPDVVANLRVDQSWGSAQIMGAVHQVGGRYFVSNLTTNGANTPTPGCLGQANTQNCGHPGNKYGWAAGAGLTLNMPWDKKDTFSGVIAYSEGATGYVGAGMGSQWLWKSGGYAVGPYTDAVFASPIAGVYDGSLQLTKAWGGTAAFEHYWTPSLRTSWVFGYSNVSYNDTAKALIQLQACNGANAALTGIVVGRNNTCNPDYSMWRLASRTMWNPVNNLDVGLEVAYTKINTAFEGLATSPGALGVSATPIGVNQILDQSVWSATVRVQRNFWP